MKIRLITFLFTLSILIPASYSTWGLTESSEARYAQISKEMYASGNYIHPTLLGIYHYHKPPMTYYITCVGYYIAGVNEIGARFFLHIALLIQLLLVYKIAHLLYKNKAISLVATLLYFSYPIVHVSASNLTTDAYLTTFIFISIFFFLKYLENRRPVFIYLFYIFCGCAFLTKGPVGILPQLLFALCYTRAFRIKTRFTLHSFLAMILGIFICLSWFVVLLYQNESFLDYFVRYQLVDRVATDVFKRSEPFWYYVVTMPLLGLPASIYLINAAVVSYKTTKMKRTVATVLSVTLVILFVIFSTSSSKLVLYVMPLYLFIAILSAKHLSEISGETLRRFENISSGFSYLIFASLMIACFIPLPYIIPAVPVLILSSTGIICTIILSRINFKVSSVKAPLINACTIAVIIFIFPFLMKANELKINSVKDVADFIKQHSGKEVGNVAVYNYLLPSISFYTNAQVLTLDNGKPSAHRETQFQNTDSSWKRTYYNFKENVDSVTLQDLMSKPNSFIIARKSRPIPDSLSVLKKHFPNKIEIEKWLIYY